MCAVRGMQNKQMPWKKHNPYNGNEFIQMVDSDAML